MSIAAKALVPVQPPVESQRPERPLKWYVVQLGTELALYAGFHEPAMERYVAGPYSNRRDACEETDRRTMKKTSRRAVVSTIALVALVFIAARLASA